MDTRPNIYCLVIVNENKQVLKKQTLSPICFDKKKRNIDIQDALENKKMVTFSMCHLKLR